MNRRKFVSSISVLSINIASGCMNLSNNFSDNNETDTERATKMTDGGISGHVRPTTSSSPTPQSYRCDDSDFIRHPSYYDSVKWGDGEDLSLRVNDTKFHYGDTARIQLINTSNSAVTVGTENKYQIEIHTADGWRDIRGKINDDTFDYTDLGTELQTGDGLKWSLVLTEKGIVEEMADLVVCPELIPGRYRFVYWGTDPAIAVAFDLQR